MHRGISCMAKWRKSKLKLIKQEKGIKADILVIYGTDSWEIVQLTLTISKQLYTIGASPTIKKKVIG